MEKIIILLGIGLLSVGCTVITPKNACPSASVDTLKKVIVAQNEYLDIKDNKFAATSEVEQKATNLKSAMAELKSLQSQCQPNFSESSQPEVNQNLMNGLDGDISGAEAIALFQESTGISFRLDTISGGQGGSPSLFGSYGSGSGYGKGSTDKSIIEEETKQLIRLQKLLAGDSEILQAMKAAGINDIFVSNPYRNMKRSKSFAYVSRETEYNDREEVIGYGKTITLSLSLDATKEDIIEALTSFIREKSQTKVGRGHFINSSVKD